MQLPIVGNALRIAPGRNGKPLANFWKFWTSGREVYAAIRNTSGAMKFSVHPSGQIHVRPEHRDLVRLAPALPFSEGTWLHALELRFLLSEDSGAPGAEEFDGKSAFVVEVPAAHVLVLNLLLEQNARSGGPELPTELTTATRIWRATLSDQREVALIGRVMPMNTENTQELKWIRTELVPKANFSTKPKEPYVEVTHIHWSSTNVLMIVPMGSEAVRVDQPLDNTVKPKDIRTLEIDSSAPPAVLLAPDGASVATIQIADFRTTVSLEKSVNTRVLLGTIRLTVDPSKLRQGETFQRPSATWPSRLLIDGTSPRSWDYKVRYAFDGTMLVVAIRPLSTALRSANLCMPMPHVHAPEEIVIATEAVILRAGFATPEASAPLVGKVLIRDR